MKKPSSISIELLNQLPRINDVRFSGNGNRLVWSESTGTLGVIFERKFNGRTHRLSGDQNARGSIGYGGGDLGVSLNQVIFPDRSGSLYIVTFNQKTSLKAITPAWGATAAPVFSPDGKWVVYCYNADEIDGLFEVATIQRMPFGKHEGELLSDLPPDYVDWLLTRDIDDDLRSALESAD